MTGIAVVVALTAGACGDDGVSATPEQRDAIATLIDAEITAGEERCLLEGLLDTGIPPEAVVAGDVTGEEDAELLGVAAGCIEDLTRIPAFVAAFMEGAAEEGTPMTEDEAICAIRHLEADDPARAVAECLADTGSDDPAAPDAGPVAYGDDEVLDLLWDACERGNNQACDELTRTAPADSGYARFGRSCGERRADATTSCFDELG